jgi:hypothetical protein
MVEAAGLATRWLGRERGRVVPSVPGRRRRSESERPMRESRIFNGGDLWGGGHADL